MTPTNRSAARPAAVLAIAFALPILAYLALVTGGNFRLFAPDYGWHAYNDYARALTHGRLDVPAASISAEGFFVNGRVYMYYGALPAFLRLPFIPFIDLGAVPLSRLMVWLMCAVAGSALQLALLRAHWAKASAARLDTLLLVCLSLVAWLASGTFVLVVQANLYHEPFAAALMLAGLFLCMLTRDVLARPESPSAPGAGRLCLYALIAGACVFARQTTAIALYATTLVLIAMPLFRRGDRPALSAIVARALPALAILGIAGLLYLELNKLRFGGYFAAFPFRYYGFNILRDFHDPRLIDLERIGQFHWSRFPGNVAFALTSSRPLHDWLMDLFGGGTTGAFSGFGLLLAWPAAFVAMGLFLRAAIRDRRAGVRRRLVPVLFVTISLGALLQLCYATAAYRYFSELWPPFGFLLICAVRRVRADPPESAFGPWTGAALALLTAVSILHALVSWLPKSVDYPRREGSLLQPVPAKLQALATDPPPIGR